MRGRKLIQQFTQCVNPGRFLFVDANAQPRLRQAEEFDAGQRVHSQIQLQVHRNIQWAHSRFRFPHELGHHSPNPLFESRVLTRRLAMDRGILALGLLSLDLKALKLAGDRPGQRLVPDRE